MKFRCAAVLASVGWYLMIQPQPVKKWQDVPPISKWEQVGSYDSSADCESDRINQYVGIAQNPKTPENLQRFVQYSTGQCIASDDSRLKK
jgi:hypothetical protein